MKTIFLLSSIPLRNPEEIILLHTLTFNTSVAVRVRVQCVWLFLFVVGRGVQCMWCLWCLFRVWSIMWPCNTDDAICQIQRLGIYPDAEKPNELFKSELRVTHTGRQAERHKERENEKERESVCV